MALDELSKYMTDYRVERGRALNNERRMRWFTSDVGTVPELFTTVCDTTKPNSTWEKVYLQADKSTPEDRVKQPGFRWEVAFVAGCRRDLRMLFAVGAKNRAKTVLDYDRFEYQRLAFYKHIVNRLVTNIQSKQKG